MNASKMIDLLKPFILTFVMTHHDARKRKKIGSTRNVGSIN